MAMVRSGEVTLNVVERGKGPPLVLVHGFPLDHSMWQKQIEHFSASHRVIAPDLRGFGKSEVKDGTSSMEIMADDLATLLTALGAEGPVVLAGLSMGGYIAFQFWRKYANLLRGLVLCDTRAVGDTPEAAAGRHKLIDALNEHGPRVVAEAMMPKLFAAETLEKQPQVVAQQRAVIEGNPTAGIAAALRGLAARPDMTSELRLINVPTLVLVGQYDAISTPEEMRTISAGIPNSQFVVIERAGHMAPLENPAATNAAIDAFMAKL